MSDDFDFDSPSKPDNGESLLRTANNDDFFEETSQSQKESNKASFSEHTNLNKSATNKDDFFDEETDNNHSISKKDTIDNSHNSFFDNSSVFDEPGTPIAVNKDSESFDDSTSISKQNNNKSNNQNKIEKSPKEPMENKENNKENKENGYGNGRRGTRLISRISVASISRNSMAQDEEETLTKCTSLSFPPQEGKFINLPSTPRSVLALYRTGIELQDIEYLPFINFCRKINASKHEAKLRYDVVEANRQQNVDELMSEYNDILQNGVSFSEVAKFKQLQEFIDKGELIMKTQVTVSQRVPKSQSRNRMISSTNENENSEMCCSDLNPEPEKKLSLNPLEELKKFKQKQIQDLEQIIIRKMKEDIQKERMKKVEEEKERQRLEHEEEIKRQQKIEAEKREEQERNRLKKQEEFARKQRELEKQREEDELRLFKLKEQEQLEAARRKKIADKMAREAFKRHQEELQKAEEEREAAAKLRAEEAEKKEKRIMEEREKREAEIKRRNMEKAKEAAMKIEAIKKNREQMELEAKRLAEKKAKEVEERRAKKEEEERLIREEEERERKREEMIRIQKLEAAKEAERLKAEQMYNRIKEKEELIRQLEEKKQREIEENKIKRNAELELKIQRAKRIVRMKENKTALVIAENQEKLKKVIDLQNEQERTRKQYIEMLHVLEVQRAAVKEKLANQEGKPLAIASSNGKNNNNFLIDVPAELADEVPPDSILRLDLNAAIERIKATEKNLAENQYPKPNNSIIKRQLPQRLPQLSTEYGRFYDKSEQDDELISQSNYNFDEISEPKENDSYKSSVSDENNNNDDFFDDDGENKNEELKLSAADPNEPIDFEKKAYIFQPKEPMTEIPIKKTVRNGRTYRNSKENLNTSDHTNTNNNNNNKNNNLRGTNNKYREFSDDEDYSYSEKSPCSVYLNTNYKIQQPQQNTTSKPVHIYIDPKKKVSNTLKTNPLIQNKDFKQTTKRTTSTKSTNRSKSSTRNQYNNIEQREREKLTLPELRKKHNAELHILLSKEKERGNERMLQLQNKNLTDYQITELEKIFENERKQSQIQIAQLMARQQEEYRLAVLRKKNGKRKTSSNL